MNEFIIHLKVLFDENDLHTIEYIVLLHPILFRAENAIRQIYPDMTLPYWDTTLESELDLPRESALFTENFMGNGNGFVITGPFANWTVQRGLLYRTVGARFSPMDDHNISVIFDQKHLEGISYPYADTRDENLTNYELVHNNVHNWVGGEMDKIETAADDPIFFIYHCFIDYVYEKFRANQRESGIDPVTDWSEYYGASRHHVYSPMGLGSLMASDGNNEVFARNVIYQDKPSCTRENTDCGTPYLWCNITRERCIPWTKREFEDMEYTAKENGKSLTEEIKVHIEYRIEQEMEKIQVEFETTPLDFNNETNNDKDKHVDKLTYQETDKALVGIEIAMIILAACLGCYAAFLITIKCFWRNGDENNKTVNSYSFNGFDNIAYEHNKVIKIPDNDVVAEITGGDMVKELSGKEYTLHQDREETKPSKTIRFCEETDQAKSEQSVKTDETKENEIKDLNIDKKEEFVSETFENEFPLYENAVFTSEANKISSVNGEKSEKCVIEKDDKDVEYDNMNAPDYQNMKREIDNTSLSGEIFTSLRNDGFTEERL